MSTTSKTGTAVPASKGVNEHIATRILIGFVVFVVLAAVVGLFISGADYVPPPTGLPDAGAFVGWMLPITKAIFIAIQIVTVGLLLLAGFLDPDMTKGIVSLHGRRALLKASIAAAIWSVSSLFLALLELANILGVTFTDVLDPGVITTYAWEVDDVRALFVAMVLAAVVAIGSLASAKLDTVGIWLAVAFVAVAAPATAGHAAGLGDHTTALVSSVAHSVAAVAWVGGLIALGATVWRKPQSAAIAAKRFGYIAIASVIVLLASGVLSAYVRLGNVSDLWTSGYGYLILLKSALFVVLLALAAIIRRRVIPQLANNPTLRVFGKIALTELLIMALASGLGVALSLSAPTRADLVFPTQGEEQLGFFFPPAPTPATVLFGFRFDLLFLTLGVVACAYYTFWVMRLRARGDKWPIGRTISWYIGWAIVIWVTNAGISMYSEVSVGLHMVQHMTLTMLAPLFLVLAAPITLALRAIKPSPSGGRGPREVLLSSLHSRIAKFVTAPVVVLFVYVFGLYGLYLTNLFSVFMSNHLGHVLMTVHFLLSGTLLAYVTIGTDPKPRSLPYWGRMLLVLAAVVLHAFFAVALMSSTSVIGAGWYTIVRPPWLIDPVQDSVAGGQIAWAVGEFPSTVMLLIIAWQWLRSERREGERRDRRTQKRDVELEDYNAYLAELNRRAEQSRD